MSISQFPPVSGGGIPTGAQSARPSAPVIGDVFYNGTAGYLEIYNGTNWIPASFPPLPPSISVVDVGTSVAYGSAQGTVTFTANSNGPTPKQYYVSTTTGGYSAVTSGTTVSITVGNNGTYSFNGIARNDFGENVIPGTASATLTTVPQAPTIGTATASNTSTDVTVTWTLGSNGGKNLTAITITPYLNGTTAQSATTAATTTATSATVSGLTQGSSYTFKVKTTNANGDSLESNATSSVTIPTLITVDFLVIAGGGGGNNGVQTSCNNGGGGGGAGGYRTSAGTSGGNSAAESALSVLSNVNFTVTVGSGGALATEGSNSVLSTITSIGGGRGGSGINGAGTSGGSGGGGGAPSGSAGTGTTNQGTSGSGGPGCNRAGGGGGASGGGSGSTGGNGLSSSITGTAVTRAGGGGGGSYFGNDGGAGGGGVGADTNPARAAGTGAVNTGSGGGGGYTNTYGGAAGGSGVVIIKYPDTRSATVSGGLTSSETSSGGFKIRTFTAGTGTVSLA